MKILEQRDGQLEELDKLKAENSKLGVQAAASKSRVISKDEKIREFRALNIRRDKHQFSPAYLDDLNAAKYERLLQESERARKELEEAEERKRAVNQKITEIEKSLQEPADADPGQLDVVRKELAKLDAGIQAVERSMEASLKAEQEVRVALERVDIEGERIALEDVRAEEAQGKVKSKVLDEAIRIFKQKQMDAKAHTHVIEEQKSLQAGLGRELEKLKTSKKEGLRDLERLITELIMVNANLDQFHMAKKLDEFARAYRRCMGYDHLLKARGNRVGVYGPWRKDFEIPRPVALQDQKQSQTSAGRPLFSTKIDVDPEKEAAQILKAL